MSGIVGIANLDKAPIDRDLLLRMTEFMSYRGPNGKNIWNEGFVGFGHSLLRTSGEENAQPLTLDGRTWLVADARIDGRAELIAKIRSKIFAVKTNPNDAEIILLAYKVWDEDCVKHLLGDFAFAIWDEDRQKLFCARDHFGVKQFFYSQTPNSFLFSNTLNALRVHPQISADLNEIAIGDFLLFGVNQDSSTTTFRDIQRLPPAHALVVSEQTIRTQRYWTPTNENRVRYRTSSSYIDQFTDILSSCVKDRIRESRVSVSMSGGLDSTSVAAVARTQSTESSHVRGYSVVYDNLVPDQERHYSDLAARQLGICITHLPGDEYGLFDAREPADLKQPEPFLISPFAGQFFGILRGCVDFSNVALTGWDGDAIMNEPPDRYFVTTVKAFRFQELLTAVSGYMWSQKRLPPTRLRTRLRISKPTPAFYPLWIDKDFSRETELRNRLEMFCTPKALTSERHAIRVLNSSTFATILGGYDAGATRLPLEVRHPLLDVRLIEYLLAIPSVPWLCNKHILRVAMKDLLPTKVLHRPKTGLQGDPALQLARDGSVRWLDSFEVSPQLKRFVNLAVRSPIAEEPTSEALWSSLRIFALNHWLMYSQATI